MPVFSCFGYIPEVELPGHMVILYFLEELQIISHSSWNVLHYHHSIWSFPFLYILPTLYFPFFKNVAFQWNGIRLWFSFPFFLNDAEQLFMCLLSICLSSWENCLFRSSPIFCVWCEKKVQLHSFYVDSQCPAPSLVIFCDVYNHWSTFLFSTFLIPTCIQNNLDKCLMEKYCLLKLHTVCSVLSCYSVCWSTAVRHELHYHQKCVIWDIVTLVRLSYQELSGFSCKIKVS